MVITLALEIPVFRAVIAGQEHEVVRLSDLVKPTYTIGPAARTLPEPLKQDSLAYEVQLALECLGPATLAEVYNVLQADDMRCNKQQVGTALGYLRRKGLVHFNRNSHQYTLIRSEEKAA